MVGLKNENVNKRECEQMSRGVPLSFVRAHNSNFRSRSHTSILRISRMKTVVSVVAAQPGIPLSCTCPRVTNANAYEPVRSCKLFSCEQLIRIDYIVG